MGNYSNSVFAVSQATVAKYMARHRKLRSQTWRTFLSNHVKQLVPTDFFVVATVTFRVLTSNSSLHRDISQIEDRRLLSTRCRQLLVSPELAE